MAQPTWNHRTYNKKKFVKVEQLEASENKTYTPEKGKAFGPVVVNVESITAGNLVELNVGHNSVEDGLVPVSHSFGVSIESIDDNVPSTGIVMQASGRIGYDMVAGGTTCIVYIPGSTYSSVEAVTYDFTNQLEFVTETGEDSLTVAFEIPADVVAGKSINVYV